MVAFPTTWHSLQSVTSKRRYGAVIMVRSQIKFYQMKYFQYWPVNKEMEYKLMMMIGIQHNGRICPFKFWLSPFTELLSGLTYKQLSQIRYHFKESLKYRRNQGTFLTFEKRNFEHWKSWILSNLIRDPPIFKAPYLRSEGTDCNEWHGVGKANTWNVLMIWHLIHRIIVRIFPDIANYKKFPNFLEKFILRQKVAMNKRLICQ